MAYLFAGGTDVVKGTKAQQGTVGDWSMLYWVRVDTAVNEASGFWTAATATTGFRKNCKQDNQSLKASQSTTGVVAGLADGALDIITLAKWYQVRVDYTLSARTMALFLGDETTAPTEVSYLTQTAGDGTDRVEDGFWFVGNSSTGVLGMIGAVEHLCLIEGSKATTAQRDQHRAGDDVTGTGVKLMLPLRTNANDTSGNGNNGTVTGATTTTGPTYPTAGGPPQELYPAAIVEANGWLADDGAALVAADLADGSDGTPDDATYAESPSDPNNEPLVVRAESGGDPGVHTGHQVTVRARRNITSGSPTLSLVPVWRTGYVNSGSRGTVVKTGSAITLTDTLTDYVLSLSEAEAANIPAAEYSTGVFLELIADQT